ncbi:MAG: UvrD-helicase domain-containing protein [Bacteroidales bacterium]|nr:UvrD-helicase domain-containing protein [Bacteroidales bacterium]
MNILYYNDLKWSKVKQQFQKTIGFLQKDDFKSAEIKKLTNTGYYRARLDYENRLLFKFAKYKDQMHILLLEVIYNHEYDKSRFLRGAKIDENKLLPVKQKEDVSTEDAEVLSYVNTGARQFHLLDKALSFDDTQDELFNIKPPVIIIGSAGSGKTVLTLEKLKLLRGNILYVTLSPFLAENSFRLYYSNNYDNDKQDIEFLSFGEFLNTLHFVPGRELDYKTFEAWLQPRKHTFGIKDSYRLFEEFRGVITGVDITKKHLNKQDYLNLGVRQSIYLDNEREKVYEVFERYLQFLKESEYFDINMISFDWLQYAKPQYDFIVIDEVQDLTNIQLYLILQTLKSPGNFMLCGDSNQIVHPNFFSWAHIKTMFYKHGITDSDIRILRTNFRNSPDITGIGNTLLKIKNARFGSIDKESTYLIDSVSENGGEVLFYKDTHSIRKQLNDKTGRSTNYAVLVMKTEDKADARKTFKTPLVFSIHEAKGLEYENIILLNFISNNASEFRDICSSLSPEQISDGEYSYSRGKDKKDKSLDAYKFYINSLYVAVTRAIRRLYVLEKSDKHDILSLLNLVETKKKLNIKEDISSLEDWTREASKLEKQGKQEQAEDIRKTMLKVEKPDWEPITHDNLGELKQEALNPEHYNKKAKDKLFAYSLLYNDLDSIEKLSELKYRKADDYEKERMSVFRKYYQHYQSDNVAGVERSIRKYGADYRDQFNMTPMLAAASNGSIKILRMLKEYNANPDVTDNNGKSPIQIALLQSWFLVHFKSKLDELYQILLTDNIKIKADDRLIKIDNHKVEYFLLHFFIALQSILVKKKKNRWEPDGVTASNIEDAVAEYPDTVLPDYRKKRSYISANLAKNEIDGNNPWNRKLFIRVERGYYVLNPGLEIFIENQWRNIYDVMRIEKVKKLSEEEKVNIYARKLFAAWDEIIETDPEWAEQLRDRIPYIDAQLKLRESSTKKSIDEIKKTAKAKHEEAQRLKKIKKENERKERERIKEEEKRRKEENEAKRDKTQYKFPF